jgi:hypothetical protein
MDNSRFIASGTGKHLKDTYLHVLGMFTLERNWVLLVPLKFREERYYLICYKYLVGLTNHMVHESRVSSIISEVLMLVFPPR